ACIALIKMPNLEQYINELGLLREINPELLTPDQYESLTSLFNESAFNEIPTANLKFLFDKSEG
ncbi:hypothetical protein NQ642_16025, partial [Acinetobacter baumannii]|nr:hypothetical protein [Acinetobacter baumannii]